LKKEWIYWRGSMGVMKKLFSSLHIFLLILLIACNQEIEISPKLENMTKEEFICIAVDVKEIEVLDYKGNKIKTIKTDEQITEVNNILVNIQEISGQVETEGNTWFLLMYNEDKEMICYISLWYRGYLGFGRNVAKEYALDIEYINALEEILET